MQAFNLLVERYQQHVYAVGFRMLRDADAEDVMQEVFLAAFRGIRRYHGGSFIAWLLRIATNKSLDDLCAPKRDRFLSLDVGAGADAVPVELRERGEGPDERVLRAELAHTLETTLDELSTD